MPSEEELAELLATFVRRRPKLVGRDPLEVLQLVTADNFRCRVCGDAVEAHPRAVLDLDDGSTITVCDGCRLKVMTEGDAEREDRALPPWGAGDRLRSLASELPAALRARVDVLAGIVDTALELDHWFYDRDAPYVEMTPDELGAMDRVAMDLHRYLVRYRDVDLG